MISPSEDKKIFHTRPVYQEKSLFAKRWLNDNRLRPVWKKSVLLLGFLFLVACDLSLAGDVTPPPGTEPPTQNQSPEIAMNGPLYPLFPANPEAGKPIYQEKCAPCHGPEGKGDGSLADRLPNPVPAIGDELLARQSRPSEWYRIVTQGRMENQMPPFESLTDQERWNVVAYVYTLSTSQTRLDRGKELYDIYCLSCHGSGKVQSQSSEPLQADNSTIPTEFTDLEWIANRSANDLYQVISTGKGDAMPAFQEQLAESDLWMVTEYLRSISLNASSGLADKDSSDTVTQDVGDSLTDEQSGEKNDSSSGLLDSEPLSNVDEETGRITGLVSNLSGGVIPDGLEIVLHEFDNMQLVITRTVKLDESGLFTIEDIPLVPQHSFLAITEFEGVTYGSDVAVFDENQDTLELPIEVYESTTDTSQVRIDRLHLFLEPLDNNILRVITLYILSNLGDKVVVPKGAIDPSVIFPLPEQANQLEFQDGQLGDRFIPLQEGFGDLTAIKPGIGSHQVLFAYILPFGNKLELLQKMSLPVQAVVVLVPEDGIRIRGENLQDSGTREVDGFLYRTYTGAGINAQDELDLSISMANAFSIPGFSSGSSIGMMIGVLALAGAVLAAVIVFYQKTRKIDEPIEFEDEQTGPQEPETAESIMDCILALDDLYKAGQLPEDAYLKRREELKDRLRQLS